MSPSTKTAFVAAPSSGAQIWGGCRACPCRSVRTLLSMRRWSGRPMQQSRRAVLSHRPRLSVTMGLRHPPPPPGSLFFDLPADAFRATSPITAAEAAAVTRASAALAALRGAYPRLTPPARRAYLDAAEATLRRVERLLAAMACATPPEAAPRAAVADLEARLAAGGTSAAGIVAAAREAYAAMRAEVGGE